jgi:hypothetical protein
MKRRFFKRHREITLEDDFKLLEQLEYIGKVQWKIADSKAIYRT